MSDSFDLSPNDPGSYGTERQITTEEQILAQKAVAVGGESKLPQEECIRLVALRYMRDKETPEGGRLRSLTEADAMELATLEYEYRIKGENMDLRAIQRMRELEGFRLGQ